MVATRRGAKKAPENAPASSTLSAPPKRGGKRKAAAEALIETTPAATKPTKITATKRKATSEPEAAQPPVAKKPTANSKATRAPKVETKPEPAPIAARRATRGKKAAEPVVVEEPEVIGEAPQPAITRGRKAPAKKAAAKVEKPVVEEVAVAAPVTEVPKPASRARKAPVAKKAEAPLVVEEHVAVEQVKATTRGRKAAAPKTAAPAPVLSSRPTRGRNVATLPQDSPLKAPARKPAKKAAPVAEAKLELQPIEELFARFPAYPTTPAHISTLISTKDAIKELPQYPQTPAHIRAPISSKAALAALPGYPETPAHITAPLSSMAAFAVLPDYPETPANIAAPFSARDAMAELPSYPKTPAHIQAPLSTEAALAQLPGYLKTPAHIFASVSASVEILDAVVSTPLMTTTPATVVISEELDAPRLPTKIVRGVTNQEAFEEMPAYPTTPAHITAPITARQVLAELPNYPQTPAHIIAPVFTTDPLTELPSYPTTPAMAMEAAVQEDIAASIKKQTPSPRQYAALDDVSFQFAETSEYSEIDAMEVDSAPVPIQITPKKTLAPPQLVPSIAAPELVSPKKSALRSPQKMDAKTPRKAVTWDDAEQSELFLYDGPLQGMTFLVDVTSNGKDQNYLFASLLEDLGAKVTKEWTDKSPSHVLFKDGSKSTLDRVVASKGSIKCVNVGWVLDSEKNKKRMEEGPYLVEWPNALPASPLPATTMKPFTPARTPSKYALPPSSECKSIPTTPTSSEFDRSFNFNDKENCEQGLYFDLDEPKQARTVPPKKSSFLLSRSPMKTPSKPSFLFNTPIKPMSVMKPFSTSKKRSHETSFSSFSLAPPKKFRLF